MTRVLTEQHEREDLDQLVFSSAITAIDSCLRGVQHHTSLRPPPTPSLLSDQLDYVPLGISPWPLLQLSSKLPSNIVAFSLPTLSMPFVGRERMSVSISSKTEDPVLGSCSCLMTFFLLGLVFETLLLTTAWEKSALQPGSMFGIQQDSQFNAYFFGVFGLRGVVGFDLTSPRSPFSTSALSTPLSFLILRNPTVKVSFDSMR